MPKEFEYYLGQLESLRDFNQGRDLIRFAPYEKDQRKASKQGDQVQEFKRDNQSLNPAGGYQKGKEDTEQRETSKITYQELIIVEYEE